MKLTDSDMAPFGTVLGMAPGDVPVYSSDYSSADQKVFPNREAYRSYVDGIFMGYKWQCVELARRWLYVNKGHVFSDIPMAYDIFRLRCVRKTGNGEQLPLRSFRNGARRRPESGCLLIWDAKGEFAVTGHVAIVTEVHDHFVRIVEQNVENRVWAQGQTFSRQLNVVETENGGYRIEDGLDDASILGWVIQTEVDEFSEDIHAVDKALFDPLILSVEQDGQTGSPWINTDDPAGAAYVSAYGHTLVRDSCNACKYVCLSESAFAELEHATNELHHLFMRATDHVLKDELLLHHFSIPAGLWPRIRASWEHRRDSMITGRFDFALSRKGLKVYEYNADSASCYYETARLQSAWAAHHNCRIGRNPGEHLFSALVRAWKARSIDEVLHAMRDTDAEEAYHVRFMKSAMEDAGLVVKTITGVSGLHWHDGIVVDPDGIPIQRVWKTWAWETAVDQIRDEREGQRGTSLLPDPSSAPRLADVLLRPEVLVHEPLWTLIPSNKAILPVMWMLFPDNPYLLSSQFDLTDEMRTSGYVEKPIVGRAGENIVLVDTEERTIRKTETDGRFGNRKRIYQDLFPLPRVEQMNIQVCTFSVAGSFAGACVRVDPSLVIKGESDVLPLRIIPDDDYRHITAGTCSGS